MLKSYMNYGCVATKVRAMYGKRLSADEWARLDEAGTMGALFAILRESRGWQFAVSLIPPGSVDVEVFTRAVRKQIRHERETLLKYVNGSDREFLSLFIREDEYRLILNALRRMKYGTFGTRREESELLRRKSRVDFPAMLASQNYDDLLRAAEHTMYYPILSSLKRDESGFPDYSSAAVAVENAYYAALHRIISKKYWGVGNLKLKELIGTEADILNILSILRIIRHFPASAGNMNAIIIPVHRRLKPPFIEALSAAPSEEAAVNMLKDSPWREVFIGYDPKRLDRMFDGAMDALCKKYLRDSDPGFVSVMAYLMLKQAEGNRLIRVITATHYNLPPLGVSS